ncbi:MAG: dephospho-CoA kinase [Prevotella sp.]|nr:dephospho-CoA kinase [Prevotella sp.]
MKIGITGGIGSGKSFVCAELARRGIAVYDCDSAAKRIMRSSDNVRTALTRLIGPTAYDGDGRLNKAAVAAFLLASAENAAAIDAIVHPAVADDFRRGGNSWMECAILFETGFNRLVDRVVAVTAPEDVRIRRVMERDGITHEKVLEWMARQWPQEEVRRCADHEIVNDGVADIGQQIDELIVKLK